MDSVANRYAVALLSIASDENSIKEYIDEIEQILEILKNNDGFVALLKSYGLTASEKKDAITNCFKDKIKANILNLFYVMIDNKRGGHILDVCKEFIRIARNKLHIKKGVVYTTIKLDEAQLLAMSQKVSKILNANVSLTNEIDTSLLGGFKIQVEDYIIDDSLKNRLEKLKDTIAKKGEA
ncbi:MAG: F0F1 ATP synthase subunit delta [Erysipelotrichaceae bacterium]|nr:F0F1 ATP synthase subunit delta [Erysipelotrichaceae bacterium]